MFQKNFLPILTTMICFLILVLSSGCGEEGRSGLIIGEPQTLQVQAGRLPPPTLESSGGGNTNTTKNNDEDETVNFADGGVTVSPVWLEAREVMAAGDEVKVEIRVVTNMVPTKGTLFVLFRLSRWARAGDQREVSHYDFVMTIPKGHNASLWYPPELWPNLTNMVSIMSAKDLATSKLPRSTVEIHTIKSGHKFTPYESVKGFKHLVFPPKGGQPFFMQEEKD